MSRQLPVRPNLEHLKKQAKSLLGELVTRDPSAKLADAYHALAREYGFGTWPKLKAHVIAMTQPTAASSPLAGQWVANYAKSRRHPLDDARSTTLQVNVAENTVTIIDVVVDSNGKEWRTENVLEADGEEYRAEQANGYSVCSRWVNVRTLAAVTARAGREVGRVTYTVSEDEKTMTVSAKAEAHQGYEASEQEVVFNRFVAVRAGE